MAPDKFSLIFLSNRRSDLDFDLPAAFEQAFREVGADVEVVRIPSFAMSSLTRRRLQNLKKIIKEKSRTRRVVFHPDITELFLQEADYMVLFSAYRTWYRQEAMRVIPHLRTPIPIPRDIDHLTWNDKPPLRVGFMGRSHSASRLANYLLRSPKWIKELCLRGSYHKYPMLLAAMNELKIPLANINAFARTETLNLLKAEKHNYPQIALELVERNFSGSEAERNEYSRHLARNTYIICPRGGENFSFRIYECLNAGRIPVIIDTNVVLPQEINWQKVSVVVPYESLDRLYEIILNHYETQSPRDFIERQREAFSTMNVLHNLHWIKDFVTQLL